MPKKQDTSILPKYKLFPKAALNYIATQEGNPLYPGSITQDKFLHPKRILKDLGKDTFEFASRPGFALSHLAVALAQGKRTLQDFFPEPFALDDIDALNLEQAKDLLKDIRGKNTKSGILNVTKWIHGSGKDFWDVVDKLNIGKAKKIKEDDAIAAIDALVTVFKSDEAVLDVKHLAGLGARLYLMSMWSLEQFAVVSDIREYAEVLEPHKTEPQAGKDFAKGEKELSKLKEMCVASLLQKAMKNTTCQKKRGLGDGEDSDADSLTKGKKPKRGIYSQEETTEEKKKASSDSSSSAKDKKKKGKSSKKQKSSSSTDS